MEVIEIIKSIDFIIFLIVGAVAGLLAGIIMKGRGFGLIGNITISIVGSVISGFVFDWLNFMNIGDIADPIIAGVVGAVILLTIASTLKRPGNNTAHVVLDYQNASYGRFFRPE